MTKKESIREIQRLLDELGLPLSGAATIHDTPRVLWVSYLKAGIEAANTTDTYTVYLDGNTLTEEMFVSIIEELRNRVQGT